ncbi:MAG: biopolymer transport protein ExbD [Bacteriovoracaceae bacterium]|jgi:biopolymer transport protein ExbD
MKFSHDEDDSEIMAEINMTPLIDVMLVLLIIFMVSSSVSLSSGLDIDLPKVGTKSDGKADSAVIISLTSDNKILVGGIEFTLETLEAGIKEALKKEGTSLVILEGDKSSRLGNAVDVIDLAKSAGATSFAIAADEK